MSKRVVITVNGEDDAVKLASALVGSWFECDPMPEDWFEFTIKPDAWPRTQATLAQHFAVYIVKEPHEALPHRR